MYRSLHCVLQPALCPATSTVSCSLHCALQPAVCLAACTVPCSLHCALQPTMTSTRVGVVDAPPTHSHAEQLPSSPPTPSHHSVPLPITTHLLKLFLAPVLHHVTHIKISKSFFKMACHYILMLH
jgi:hypothetical protein